jgi:hypothetical protein
MLNAICETGSRIQFDKEFIRDDFDFINIEMNNIIPEEGSKINEMDLQNTNFGIINLKINKKDPITQKRHFVFSVDCSGSMSDLCKDGRTKMDHSNHTLINMITYFAYHLELNVSITVFAFDDSIYTIIENQQVTQDNLDKLIENIKKIRPKDMTNIEKALTNSADYIMDYSSNKNNNEAYITHIFMTDGDATIGCEKPNELKNFVSPLISNIFIGFGIDHNAYLLKEFAASNSKNNYYFVDALEKAGLVYGEVLHSIIYRVLENTNIRLVNGLVYDWKKNKWVDRIDIGDLISECDKIFHVLSDNPSEFSCIVQSSDCISKETFEVSIQNTIKKVYDTNNGFIDLTNYKYRQKTQQLLSEVNTHNFDKITNNIHDHNVDNYNLLKEKDKLLKNKMKDLLKEMQQFLEKDESKSDTSFIKLLCDDIYVCLQTFDTKHGAMYSCARQTSQGSQRAYSATCTPKAHSNNDQNHHVFDIPDFGSPMIKRSYAVNYKNDCCYDDDLNNDNFNKPFYRNHLDENENENEDDGYKLSDQVDNPYSTLSILDLMRSCSNI